ncbi:mitochondrial D-lactate dehydrogenase [Lipomyces kononenkoae]|uniref:Mitochondrial D-lactate dehydrogenase n=1 Tax=Lipomyces kononenkoae TaxID=34357 RepID=A0ACC3T4Q7_LIPKO
MNTLRNFQFAIRSTRPTLNSVTEYRLVSRNLATKVHRPPPDSSSSIPPLPPRPSTGYARAENRKQALRLILIISASVSLGSILAQWTHWDLTKRAAKVLSERGLESSTSPLATLDRPLYADSKTAAKAYAEITQLLGAENVSATQDDISTHADSAWLSHHADMDQRPGLVVFPRTTEQVSGIMKICHKYRVPIVPFSGGTSLEGHFIQTRSGVTIDFRNMAEIIQLHHDDLDVVVQPAVPWERLNEYLEPYGLFFPPDPGPGAQIGGMIGTGCSGTNAARYGTMREWVLSLTVVLADGTIVKTRQRPRKSSAGYNLTNLIIGSEGTLGIVTEATLKLAVLPPETSVAVATFLSVKDATRAVQEIVRKGIPVSAVELLDKEMMKCINDAGETSREWREEPTLFFKFGGTPNAVKEQIKQTRQLVRQFGSKSFEFAKSADERQELWEARKEALWSTLAMGGEDYSCWTTDVAVPVSRLSEIVSDTRDDMDRSGITGTIVGHVGDGNFHAFILYNDANKRTAEGVVHRLVERAITMEGTCTGEHGVGMVKRPYLETELGTETVDMMRRIKMALDPLGLLNADKVINVDPSVTLKKLDGESVKSE